MQGGRLQLDALELVRLPPLMERTSGSPDVAIGLIDGPIAVDHINFRNTPIRTIPDAVMHGCSRLDSMACQHGTLVAGVLSARRDSQAPAICPSCTLLVRPIFSETTIGNGALPSATPTELAAAIGDTVDAGALVINLSMAPLHPSRKGELALQEALDYSAARGVIVVAAAGNQALVGSTCITRHPWVLPVAASRRQGGPLDYSNLGTSIGQRGVLAPGEDIVSLGAHGSPMAFGGTSAAAPFVSGAIALLWSEFPGASAADVKLAVTGGSSRRRMIVPPALDAWGAYQTMARSHRGGGRPDATRRPGTWPHGGRAATRAPSSAPAQVPYR